MPRYWVIAAVESKPPQRFEEIWQFDLVHNVISIGWSKLGDVSQMTREQLYDAVAVLYPSKPATTKSLYANMIWSFYHEIVPGDIVIARRGRKVIAAVGKVTKAAYYSPEKFPRLSSPEWRPHAHPNFLDVAWQEQPRNKMFPTVVFGMMTLAEISEVQYRSLIEDSIPPPNPEEVDEALDNPSEFALEKYLEDFIVSNFGVIFKGEMELFEDAEGNEGQQYVTEIGPIDILAIEPRSNSFVVIELKKGRPSDKVVGQVLRYMGWVKKNLCTDGQIVRGLVICRDPDPKLSFALEMTKNIDVRYYNVSFKLRESP